MSMPTVTVESVQAKFPEEHLCERFSSIHPPQRRLPLIHRFYCIQMQPQPGFWAQFPRLPSGLEPPVKHPGLTAKTAICGRGSWLVPLPALSVNIKYALYHAPSDHSKGWAARPYERVSLLPRWNFCQMDTKTARSWPSRVLALRSPRLCLRGASSLCSAVPTRIRYARKQRNDDL
uniref:Uncharacterized protein n=1 Tax=Spironucleus salmonicida TaxID=348837 RepID=V6M675_9EUKA|eukprot:EST48894.1 Hypothetical protein SS50377_10865 [Spironucleus salmonicida]